MTSICTNHTIPPTFVDVERPHVFVEPLATRASRLPALRSTGSSRGEIYCAASNRIVVYESSLEWRAAVLFLASIDVSDIWDQPTPVVYIDSDGKKRSHTFDFLVIMKGGQKVAVAVKPFDRATATGLFDKMSLIAKQLDPAFANKIVVLTDKDLDPVAVHEAELVLIARRTCDQEADDAIVGAAETLLGAVPVQQLVDRLGLGSRGFSAVARAIGLGLLRRVSHGPLSASSMVKSVVSEGCL